MNVQAKDPNAPLSVYIVAPTLDEAQAIAFAVSIGSEREVRSNWWAGVYTGIPKTYRENRSAMLSTPQLRELADKIAEEVHASDLLISAHNRNLGSSRGSTFWAGYAYARRIPVIIVGAFDEVALYGSRVFTAELNDVRDVLKKVEKTELALRKFDQPFNLMDANFNTRKGQGESHVNDNADGAGDRPSGSTGTHRDDGTRRRDDGEVDGDGGGI